MNELINTKMAPSSECTGKSQHALLVKRYREIVFDCNAEYSKTCASIVRRREAHVTASVSGGNNDNNGWQQQCMTKHSTINQDSNIYTGSGGGGGGVKKRGGV
jgi:hypothetical protein